jgi:hypothetical protein
VYYEGKELTSDLTSVQIALWNAGKESVKRENILSKIITLSFEPQSSILEARAKKVTRGIVNFQLDMSRSANGILNCSWDVFEPGDGALLEVFYAGSVSAKLVVDGVVESQVPIREGMEKGQPVLYISLWQRLISSFIGLCVGSFAARVDYHRTRKVGECIFVFISTGIASSLIIFLLIGIFGMLTSHSVPFAF